MIPADVRGLKDKEFYFFTDLTFYTLVKGRTNIELREQLTDSEGKKSLYNEDGTISAVGPITKVCDRWWWW